MNNLMVIWAKDSITELAVSISEQADDVHYPQVNEQLAEVLKKWPLVFEGHVRALDVETQRPV
ncbi:MAG: hypothetical protein GOMPHAMPRED_003381 [Gomphillus americanus]|uniref:Uncharacterized protein n=1 Tax=Gomphillus americanus TaxID=1940652 RepID=A0A8H3I756_9LECA|nr:MAG: hypothetical protein GOMPHAMPRED_003381 [Gomphillus americanus]